MKIARHYEDGVEVASCTSTRGSSGGSNSQNWGNYFTKYNSKYSSTSWKGSKSNSKGLNSAGEPVSIFTYSLDQYNHATITGYKGNATSVIVPDTIDGYKVVTIGSSAFASNKSIRSVIIPDSVTTIGDQAFNNCTLLASVTLSKNLETLGKNAFNNCMSLRSIEIPKSLASVYIPGYYPEKGGVGPFQNCSNLKTVTFEEGTTKIVGYLFSDCKGIEEIVIPDTVTSIESGAFNYCSNLSDATIGKSVTAIGSYAFNDCTSLGKIVFPESVTSVGTYAFASCSSLKEAEFKTDNTTLGTHLFDACTSLEKVKLPANITKLPDSVLKNCSSLKEFNMPQNITSIEQYAFYNCDALTSVEIPSKVTSIGTYAFQSCEKLKNVTLSKGLTQITSYCFADNPALEEIEIPHNIMGGVTTISANAFKNDTALKKVIIPVTVTSIGSEAFSYSQVMTVYGCKGTYAETYANANNFKFVDITNHISGICLADSTYTNASNQKIGESDSNSEKLTFTRSQTVTPLFDYLPADTTDILTLSTNNTSVASIKNNQIYGNGNGTTTVTATTSGGLTYDFTVYVHTLNSIAISQSPTKTTYKYGEALDLGGIAVTANFSDGTSETVDSSSLTFSGYNPEKYGDQTVTVSWCGKNATYKVTVTDDRVKAISISVTTLPNKTEYVKGEAFDGTGMVVTAAYTDGTKAAVTGYSVSAMNSLKTGTQTLTVTYTDPVSGNNLTTTFTVTVGTAPQTVSFIAVKSNPTKTAYAVGDTLDTTGLKLTVTYSDGSAKDVASGFTCSPTTLSTAGTQTITVTYSGKTATFTVSVKSAAEVLADAKAAAKAELTTAKNNAKSDEAKTAIDNAIQAINNSTSVDDVTAKKNNALNSASAADKALADAKSAAKSALSTAKSSAKSDEAKAAVDSAVANVDKATNLSSVASAKSAGLTNASNADKALADAKTSALNELSTTKANSTSDEAKAAVDTAVTNVNKATNLNSVANAKSTGLTNAANADKALADAKAKAIAELENAKANARTEEEKKTIDESINKVKAATNLAAVKAASINFDNVVIKTASAQTIDYRSIVTIKATATDVPEGYKLAIYLGSQKVSEGDNKSVSYEYGELKSDLNYSVKVIDANGKVQKDSSGNEVSKDGGKITCNAGFFKKLIAFFKGLFGSLAKIEVKP